jgi:acyl-CoA thioester hydrolase
MSFRLPLRVRFDECDMYAHVNHAAYLHYMETARVYLLRQLGIPLAELQARGVILVIRRLTIEYSKPAFLDDDIEVSTEVVRLRATSGTFRQVVSRGSDTLVEAEIEWVALGQDGRPARLPPEMQALCPARPGAGT